MTGLRQRGGALLVAPAVAALLVGSTVVAAGLTAGRPSLAPRAEQVLAVPLPVPALAAAVRPPAARLVLKPARPALPPAAAAHPAPRPRAATTAEQQVVDLTNRARAQAGCGALKSDARLARAARAHSTDMVEQGYFDHDSPDGRTFEDRETAAGYPDPGGENIAYGQKSAAEVMDDWLNSPDHRENILDCTYTTVGVGLDRRGMFWTQDFGR